MCLEYQGIIFTGGITVKYSGFFWQLPLGICESVQLKITIIKSIIIYIVIKKPVRWDNISNCTSLISIFLARFSERVNIFSFCLDWHVVMQMNHLVTTHIVIENTMLVAKPCISTRFVILASFMDNKFAKAWKMHKGWFEKGLGQVHFEPVKFEYEGYMVRNEMSFHLETLKVAKRLQTQAVLNSSNACWNEDGTFLLPNAYAKHQFNSNPLWVCRKSKSM